MEIYIFVLLVCVVSSGFREFSLKIGCFVTLKNEYRPAAPRKIFYFKKID